MRNDIIVENLIKKEGEKVNKSALARQYSCCWRTIDRRLNTSKYNFEKKKKINFDILNSNNSKVKPLKEHNLKIYLKDLFNMERGIRLIENNRIFGNIPFVTAGYMNSGLTSFVGNKNI